MLSQSAQRDAKKTPEPPLRCLAVLAREKVGSRSAAKKRMRKPLGGALRPWREIIFKHSERSTSGNRERCEKCLTRMNEDAKSISKCLESDWPKMETEKVRV